MFAYFDDVYPWNMAVNMAVDMGAKLGEIDEACRPLRDLLKSAGLEAAEREWPHAWSRIATRLEKLAKADAAAGHLLSAGNKMRRASACHVMAERMTPHHRPERSRAAKAARQTLSKAVEWRRDDAIHVQIPYEGRMLPALYASARGATPSPVMIQFGGFDVGKEFLYLAGVTQPLLDRGISTLLVDQPGVGETLEKLGLPSISESERPASAAIDWLVRQPNVDASRVGIIAPSLGGYYAPRAAAFEKRLACCVAWGARWDNDGSHGRIMRNQTQARSLTNWLDHAMRYYGTRTVEETASAIAAMTLDGGIAERIECPLLVVHGCRDRQVPIEQAHLTVARASSSRKAELRIFTDDEGGVEHCGADNTAMQADFMADWISDVFATGPLATP